MSLLPRGRAICYSGYREGQRPGHAYPSLDQIREDLRILQPDWQLLRLYDCTPHAERVLEVIRRDRMDFKVMLGAYLGAEADNPACPWGGIHGDERLAANAAENEAEVGRLIALANAHEDIVFSVAVGNESTVDWTDHLVPVPRMIEHVRRVRRGVRQPVTFCENYVPWQDRLRDLVPELDFIALHSYPVWEHKQLHEALAYTRDNFDSVARRHPGKPVVITEAGWTTHSNGRGIRPDDTSQELQAAYLRELLEWTDAAGILCFVFEAFDEPWKGSPDPLEPEKHWGLYTVDRRPKLVMRDGLPKRPASPRGG
jgi:exo-beta-1,3-glucanase (GH17 family)